MEYANHQTKNTLNHSEPENHHFHKENDLLALTTQGAPNHLPKKLKGPNGNTMGPLREKKSTMSQLSLSHKQSTSLSTQYPT